MCSFAVAWVFISIAAMAAEPVTWVENRDALRKSYRLVPDYERVETRTIRIAVLDNGFQGAKEHKYLPDSKVLVEKYAEGDVELDATDAHGRLMAQIAWAMTGRLESGPKFYLLNARGTDNFKKAVDHCLALPQEEKIDIALISMNFESTGNFKGDGFVNAHVNRLAASGTIVIVAAGNYGGNVFNGPVTLGTKDSNNVQPVLFGQKDYLELKSRVSDDPARQSTAPEIILSWNAFSDDAEAGTEKDLDLFVYDERDEILAKKEMKQVRKKDALAEGETYLARERVEIPGHLEQGKRYRIRVKAKNGIFDAARDTLRVTMKSNRSGFFSQTEKKPVDAIEFIDATPGKEIMVPADNPNVVTVGEMSPFSAKGPTLDNRAKPDVLMAKTDVTLSDQSPETGSSVAAAMLAGIAAVLKTEAVGLTKDHLKTWIAPVADSRLVSVDLRRHLATDLIALLDKEYPTGRQLAIYEGTNSQITLVVPEFTSGIRGVFQGFDWTTDGYAVDQLELYLAVRRNPSSRQTAPRGYVVPSGAPRPWEPYKEKPELFTRIARAWRVWQTPSPTVLRAAVSGR